jgi:hypothetical protein
MCGRDRMQGTDRGRLENWLLPLMQGCFRTLTTTHPASLASLQARYSVKLYNFCSCELPLKSEDGFISYSL